MNPLTPCKNTTILPVLAALTLVCFALSPRAQAACQNGCLGNRNTALGDDALINVTSGFNNTAVGNSALKANRSGEANTATGRLALSSNTNGISNTAAGQAALRDNTTGNRNTATGRDTLLNNTTGNDNTVTGLSALRNNTTGSSNTALGAGAGPNVVTGVNNTYLGDFVGTLSGDESGTIRIGDLSNGNGAGSLECFIGGIFNNFQPAGGSVVEVTLDLANDHLGWDNPPTQSGSAPVQRGAALPGVRPQHQAMLDGKVEKLEATVAQQQKQIEALTAGLQKVSAQLELSKSAPQTVLNNQ